MKNNIYKKYITIIWFLWLLYCINFFLPITLLTSYHEISYRDDYNQRKIFKNNEEISISDSLYNSSLDLINSTNWWWKKYIIIPFIFKIVDGGWPYNDSLSIYSKNGDIISNIENVEILLKLKGEEYVYTPYNFRSTTNNKNHFYDFIFDISWNKGEYIKYKVLFEVLNTEYEIKWSLSLEEERYFGPFWFYMISRQ